MSNVILYVPGTMRSAFDQSVDLFARHLAVACSAVRRQRYLVDRTMLSLAVDSSTELKVRRIHPEHDEQDDVILVEVDYSPILSTSLGDSGVIIQFLKYFWLMLRMSPVVARIILRKLPPQHSQITSLQRLLVLGIYFSGIVALVSVASLALEIFQAAASAFLDDPAAQAAAPSGRSGQVAGLLAWITTIGEGTRAFLSWMSPVGAIGLVLVGFLPSAIPERIVTIGKEYYGLVRYLLRHEKRDEIDDLLRAAAMVVAERYPAAQLHLVCFSFGCVAAFNHLFPGKAWQSRPAIAPSSVTFLGFPFAVIQAAFPAYFSKRCAIGPTPQPWQNIYLAHDVLGSKIGEYVPGMISEGPGDPPAIVDKLSTAELDQGADLITMHMAYWSTEPTAPSDVFRDVARAVLQESQVS